jgi:hypothetical protein
MSQDPRTPTVVTGLRLDAVIWARFRAYARFMNADLSRMASAAVAEYLDRRSFPDGKPRDGASPVPLISETGYLTRRRPTRQELIARAQWEQRLRRTRGRPLSPDPERRCERTGADLAVKIDSTG